MGARTVPVRATASRISVCSPLRCKCASPARPPPTKPSMPRPLELPQNDGSDDAHEENNQQPEDAETRQPDAFGAVDPAPGDQGGSRGIEPDPALTVPNLDITRLTPRDVAVIRHLVLLRLLTYDQVHRIAFASVDMSIARRRIRHLARAGWLATWEAPSRRGGHVRYAHPTADAIRTFLPTLVPETSWAPLVHRMVPRSQRRPLELGATVPKWLAHQREVNHLVASIVTCPARRVLWASSWDCPLPSRAGMFALPQPDYVLVEEVDGIPQFVFGEHDRGSEPVSRFIARKIALYSALAAFPEVCMQQFGFATFRVHVTAIDPLRRAPIRRLRSLIDAARSSEGSDIFKFTLGGWLYTYPAAPIWFTSNAPPAKDSVAWSDHVSVACAA